MKRLLLVAVMCASFGDEADRSMHGWDQGTCPRHQSATIEDALSALLKELDARR